MSLYNITEKIVDTPVYPYGSNEPTLNPPPPQPLEKIFTIKNSVIVFRFFEQLAKW